MKHIASIILFLFVSLVQFSCAERCNGENYNFRVRMEISNPIEGEITVSYLTRTNTKNWTSFKTTIIEGDKNHFVEFCFAEEPVDFKFFVPGMMYFKIHNILLENNDRQKFILGDKSYLYFAPNKALKYNKEELSYQLLEETKIRPCISARVPLKKLLRKRLKENNVF